MTSPSPAPVTTSAASIAWSGAAAGTAAAIAIKPAIARPSPSTDKALYRPSAETSRPPITEATISPAQASFLAYMDAKAAKAELRDRIKRLDQLDRS